MPHSGKMERFLTIEQRNSVWNQQPDVNLAVEYLASCLTEWKIKGSY